MAFPKVLKYASTPMLLDWKHAKNKFTYFVHIKYVQVYHSYREKEWSQVNLNQVSIIIIDVDNAFLCLCIDNQLYLLYYVIQNTSYTS